MNQSELNSLNLFWSYDISTLKPLDALVIEQVLKFGDTHLLVELFEQVRMEKIEKIWNSTMKNDLRFERQNFYLKKFFLPKTKHTFATQSRLEKLKELAAKH